MRRSIVVLVLSASAVVAGVVAAVGLSQPARGAAPKTTNGRFDIFDVRGAQGDVPTVLLDTTTGATWKFVYTGREDASNYPIYRWVRVERDQ